MSTQTTSYLPPNDHAQGEAPIPVSGATAALVLIGVIVLVAIMCGKGGR